MVHGLPLRREHLFAVHLVCGSAMQLIPHRRVFRRGQPPVPKERAAFAGIQPDAVPVLLRHWHLLRDAYRAADGGCGHVHPAELRIHLCILCRHHPYLPLMPGGELNWDSFMRFCPPASMSISKVELLGSYGGYTKHLALFALAAGRRCWVCHCCCTGGANWNGQSNFMAFPGLNFLFLCPAGVLRGASSSPSSPCSLGNLLKGCATGSPWYWAW